ncbi:MAG: single-stranded DNA-binding protein [Jatrophihabitans sp.]
MTQTRPRASRKTRAESADGHRNEVLLVGLLGRAPAVRELPDGEEITTFTLAVRGGEGASGSDLIDCVARRAAIRTRLVARSPGDTVEVSGPLRHRFWRAGGALLSRYEVEVERITLRGRLSRPSAGPGRRTDE